MKFLCLLWTQHTNNLACDLHLNPVIQARSLKLGHAVIMSITGKQLTADIDSLSGNNGSICMRKQTIWASGQV